MFAKLIGSTVSAYTALPNHRGKPRLLRALSKVLVNVPVRSRYGVWMMSRPDSTTAMSIAGAYDDVFDAVCSLEPGMAFVDVGANAGVFSLVAAKRVGPAGIVVAFEPHPSTFRLLVGNAGVNGFDNIVPFNAAIAGETRIARFDPARPRHSGGAHLDERGDLAVLQLGRDQLAAILPVLIGERRVMVKIDVEGAECLVMRALTDVFASRSVRRVVAEISRAGLARYGHTPENVYDEMDAHGFCARLGRGHGRHYNEVFERPDA